MTSEPIDLIRAAGAVVWRDVPGGTQVALIHRPDRNDWTFPKGKLKPGEHELIGAHREVLEETGLDVLFGRALPPVHYMKAGRLKRVDYWTASVISDAGLPLTDEVDDVVWVPVAEARTRLTYEWDVALLGCLFDLPLRTVPLILVRHGDAGSRQYWTGPDELRPLDEAGQMQASVFREILYGYRPTLLMSSPALRCTQMLETLDLPVAVEPVLTEAEYDPTLALDLAVTTLQAARPTVICSHGKVLPELISGLCAARSEFRPSDTHLKKGAFCVLHAADGRAVALERYLIP